MNGEMVLGGPMMAMGLVAMILFLALIIAGVVWLVRTLMQGRPGRGSEAVDRLDWRYARGEIDRDEYLQRRDDLVGS